MFADGEVHDAERVVRQFLLEHGDHVEAMRLLARIGVQLDILDDAEFLLESVLAFAPDYHLARYEYVNVLLKLHKYVKALEEIDKLLKARTAKPSLPHHCMPTPVSVLAIRKRACGCYRELAAEAPAAADIRLSIAHALKTLGRQQQAIESYRAAAEVKPSFGDAYWSLANLKTYRFTDEEVARMRSQEAAATTQLRGSLSPVLRAWQGA